MQTKQKVILGCAVAITLAAPMAHAAVTIAATETPAAATVVGGASGGLGGFTVSDFVFQQSRNVAVYADGNATAVAVSTASTKGRQTFGGSSNGGSVAACQSTSVASPAPLSALTLTAAGTGCN